MDLRPYQPSDREGCLGVFDSNLPGFFHPAERTEFAGFLERPDGSYFVLDHEGAIVGCGGFALENAGLASICWLMVRQDLHRNGLGKFLLFAAMRKMTAEGDPTLVRLDTTPQVAAFFERQGFRTQEVKRDGIAPGFDRVEMVKKMKVCG